LALAILADYLGVDEKGAAPAPRIQVDGDR
jgi:hypothetical protein